MSEGDRATPVMPEMQTDAQLAQRRIYERQHGEPDDAWTCFEAYRDMDPPRRLMRSGYLGGVKVASATLSEWYRRWKWDERVEAYDVLMDRIVQAQRKKALEQAVDEVTADHLSMLKDLRSLVGIEIKKYLEATRSNDVAGMVKAADLKGLIEASIKMDRLCRDQTTDKTEAEVDLSGIPLEELIACNERLAGAKKT